jgi:hypothetical protein
LVIVTRTVFKTSASGTHLYRVGTNTDRTAFAVDFASSLRVTFLEGARLFAVLLGGVLLHRFVLAGVGRAPEAGVGRAPEASVLAAGEFPIREIRIQSTGHTPFFALLRGQAASKISSISIRNKTTEGVLRLEVVMCSSIDKCEQWQQFGKYNI